ncbi:hypothetical protein H072_3674 [Dactylellina haptotyla CBS 200.50]|uniref:MOSC domain-containing protein n=1 Tax=Dactylellina haptotyla (strain CBS 200.50) TaxID=1284197 RepID=S8AMP6_DACHA|nr:hypothetical protein H072_3674 [Dactylellina haptotyla CBS 200.50]
MKISKLYVYPVKSLRGCSVASATLTAQGLKYDRKYMLVRVHTQPDGSVTYESQYVGNVDVLCLFTTSFLPNDEEPHSIRITYNEPTGAPAATEKAEKPYIDIPVAADYKQLETVDLIIHLAHCIGYDMGAACEEFFTKYLGFPTKLVYVGDSTREVKGNVAPNKMHVTGTTDEKQTVSWSLYIYGLVVWLLGYLVGSSEVGSTSEKDEDYRIHFSDCAPLLVTSEVSLEEFNRARKESEKEIALDMSKTRPNIVVGPSEAGDMSAFEEDFWGELTMRNLKQPKDSNEPKILLTSNCGRCKSLNVDYDKGKQQPVSDQMLKRLSDMKRRVDPGHGYSPIFGRYGFIAKDSVDMKVRVGDLVEVSKTNEERTVFYWPGLSAGTKPKKS